MGGSGVAQGWHRGVWEGARRRLEGSEGRFEKPKGVLGGLEGAQLEVWGVWESLGGLGWGQKEVWGVWGFWGGV